MYLAQPVLRSEHISFPHQYAFRHFPNGDGLEERERESGRERGIGGGGERARETARGRERATKGLGERVGSGRLHGDGTVIDKLMSNVN